MHNRKITGVYTTEWHNIFKIGLFIDDIHPAPVHRIEVECFKHKFEYDDEQPSTIEKVIISGYDKDSNVLISIPLTQGIMLTYEVPKETTDETAATTANLTSLTNI